MYSIYKYINWNLLRKYDGIPDSVWEKICEDFCQDIFFKEKYVTYWNCNGYEKIFTCKEKFLYFMNYLIADRDNRSNIPSILLKDKQFVILILRRCDIFEYIHDGLKDDPEVILEYTRWDYHMLCVIDKRFRADKSYLLRAVNMNFRALRYADNIITHDREIMSEMIQINPCCLYYASSNLKSDKEVVSEALKSNVATFKFADESLKCDKQFILENIKYGTDILGYVDDKIVSDPEFMLEVIKQFGAECTFEYGDFSLRKNRDFMIKATQFDILSARYVHPTLKSDPEFMLRITKYSTPWTLD